MKRCGCRSTSSRSNALHDAGAALSGDDWVIELTNQAFDQDPMLYDPSRDHEIAEVFATALA